MIWNEVTKSWMNVTGGDLALFGLLGVFLAVLFVLLHFWIEIEERKKKKYLASLTEEELLKYAKSKLLE